MKRRDNLRDEGMACVSMLFIGLTNTTFIPRGLRHKMFPFLVVAVVLCLAIYWYQLSQYSEQELTREGKDERNRMIQEKASWYSRRAEDWILIGLYAVFTLGFQQYTIGYSLLWFMIGRYVLSFCIRWWLNRKY